MPKRLVRRYLKIGAATLFLACTHGTPAQQYAQQQTPPALADSPPLRGNPYDIGSPVLSDIYISTGGSDSNSGSPTEPLQTLGEAWRRSNDFRSSGYRINLLPGTYPCEPLPEALDNCMNYLSERSATYQHPLIIRAANGPGTVTLRGGLNIAQVAYLYLLDLSMQAGPAPFPVNSSGNNVLHIEQGDHILLRNITLQGPSCIEDTCNNIQEVLKINQSQHIYLENSVLSGTRQTILDFVTVQHGHIIDSRLSRSGGRCMYLKGGSAYFLITRSRLSDCREAGMQAGEGTNIIYMRSPWLHYESYDIKIINNLIHDIYGAGVTVAGSYNILFAYNTLYRIGLNNGSASYGLLGTLHGARACAHDDAIPDTRCQELLDVGGWGTATLGEGGEWIPNRNVLIYNNIFYNPTTGTRYTHVTVNGPITPPAHTRNIPNPSRTDDGLSIRGNLIWNKLVEPGGLIGDNNGSGNLGCRPDNPTCNETQLQNDNSINRFEPALANPAAGDFRPAVDSNIISTTTYLIPDFGWGDAPPAPAVPSGTLTNNVSEDYNRDLRSGSGPPGAYLLPDTARYRLALPFIIRPQF